MVAFAAGLRSLMRQDPDVIMVGEIRDEETASLAINASLTGHLVLTTATFHRQASESLKNISLSEAFISHALPDSLNRTIALAKFLGKIILQQQQQQQHSYQLSEQQQQESSQEQEQSKDWSFADFAGVEYDVSDGGQFTEE